LVVAVSYNRVRRVLSLADVDDESYLPSFFAQLAKLQSSKAMSSAKFVDRLGRMATALTLFVFKAVVAHASSHNVINYNYKKAMSKGRVVVPNSCSIPILSCSKADGWH
jgi:hypothetical protein